MTPPPPSLICKHFLLKKLLFQYNQSPLSNEEIYYALSGCPSMDKGK